MADRVSAEHAPYAQVAVPGPHRSLFTYRVPAPLDALARPGHRVLIPFGRRQLVGIVWSRESAPPDGLAETKIKPVSDALDAHPVLTPVLRELCAWVARYYRAPLGEVARLAGPPGAGWARGPERVVLSVPPEGATVDVMTLPESVREVYYAALELMGAGEAHAVSVATLARKVGRDALHYRLRSLEAAGALAIEFERPRAGAPARERFVYEATPGAAEELETLERAPKQRDVLDYLLANGPTETAVLEKEIGGAAGVLRTLMERGLVVREGEAERRDPWRDLTAKLGGEFSSEPPAPTAAQAKALQRIDASLATESFQPFLLWGVTGSGKTEVYLRAIERALAQGRTALVLVPEIALTPLLAARFVSRFGARAAILHSGLSAGERHDEWQRLRSGEARVALGVRAALYAPLSRIGLIVVDEEHESAYKQSENPAYNARDGAVKRAQLEEATVLLGSATPSLETLANVEAGRYERLELPERVGKRPLSRIELVDLKNQPRFEKEEESPRPWFWTERLERALFETLEKKQQAIVYLNRRGFASTLLCHDCGRQLECPSCAVRLRVHGEGKVARLLCHYCGYEAAAPETCGKCGGTRLRPAGLGTQQVERVLRERLPEARIARLDRDAVSKRGALSKIIADMRAGAVDVLLGTQMVAKGHDFPAVTLVAVLLADLAWAVPDFRAEERAWQQLAQVAGRAGRGDEPGTVLLQSFDLETPLLSWIGEEQLWRFAERELAQRRALNYPPAWRLALIRASATQESPARDAMESAARAFSRFLSQAQSEAPGSDLARVRLAGPAPAPIARLRGRWRWQLLLKGPTSAAVQRTLDAFERWLAAGATVAGGVRFSIDVDPQELL